MIETYDAARQLAGELVRQCFYGRAAGRRAG